MPISDVSRVIFQDDFESYELNNRNELAGYDYAELSPAKWTIIRSQGDPPIVFSRPVFDSNAVEMWVGNGIQPVLSAPVKTGIMSFKFRIPSGSSDFYLSLKLVDDFVEDSFDITITSTRIDFRGTGADYSTTVFAQELDYWTAYNIKLELTEQIPDGFNRYVTITATVTDSSNAVLGEVSLESGDMEELRIDNFYIYGNDGISIDDVVIMLNEMDDDETEDEKMGRKYSEIVNQIEITPQNMMLDAGMVIVNFEILGTLELKNVVAGDKVIIAGDTYTAAASTSKASKQFSITNATEELAACINDETNGTEGVTATVDGNVIILTAADPDGIAVTGSTNIIYDDFYREYEFGITDGDNQFSCEKELKEIAFNGARGKVKGMERITRFSAKLTTNVKELSSKTIAMALTTGRIDTESSETHDIITAALDIMERDYPKNIALIAPKFGTDEWYAFILKNPLQTGNFDVKTQDKNEGSAPLTFEAHFDPKKLNEVPIEIRKPKGVN